MPIQRLHLHLPRLPQQNLTSLSRRSLSSQTIRTKRTSPLPAQQHLQPQTTRRHYASKDAPGKDDLNPTSTEYSKSGGDNAAAHSEEAFDPSSTRPESESAGDDSLNVSPGNPDVNKTKQAENTATGKSPGEAGESSDRAATSQRGSPKKSG